MTRYSSADPARRSSLDVGQLYRQYKAYAFSIAYRMMGSVVEAEDIVQDCFVALQSITPGDECSATPEIVNPKGYIAKLVVHRSLNVLHSARNQRESYVGEWLPEPMAEGSHSPEEEMEHKEMVSYAYLVMLERLSPVERAVFVLREAFGHEYRDIAAWIGKTESNCRQLFSRAKRSLPRSMSALNDAHPDFAAKEQLLTQFTTAFMNYDVPAMMELLAQEPVFTADGGGEVRTVMRTMKVRKGVLALLTSPRTLTALRQLEWRPISLNGELHIALLQEGRLMGVLCVQADATGTRIEGVYLQVNPNKLGRVMSERK